MRLIKEFSFSEEKSMILSFFGNVWETMKQLLPTMSGNGRYVVGRQVSIGGVFAFTLPPQ
jgi:hypothetical protein